MAEVLRLQPKPLEADPAELLVVCGLATRRAWLVHYRLAPCNPATLVADAVILSCEAKAPMIPSGAKRAYSPTGDRPHRK